MTTPAAPRPAAPATPAPAAAPSARTVRWEIAIVLGLSLGRSAVYAVVDLLEKMSRGPLAGQTTTLNPPLADRQYFDLAYQLLDIGFALVPVLLVFHLLWIRGRNPFRTLGLDLRRPGADLGWGAALFLVIGLGTLAVYAGGRAAGLTTAVVGSAMNEYWWTTPVLVLSALRHAVLEEVIVVAWLFDRLGYLQQLRAGADPALPVAEGGLRRWAGGAFPPLNPVAVVVACAVLRAAYHLYQGIGPGIGNLVMGLVFGAVYLRHRRVAPLVVAHLLLDVTGFVAYPLLAQLGWFGT
ncbi:CPBP family intramembrane metalloprotease [Citricoccus sp. SGAir0253]|uniref:CPBP family glutamic-type intramembrane protease n=1 Tax=Citricoccus sp. SGAir0253 TaxID=2567881 RepID=UPI0010CD10FE|nr:CPBP family intramembrane glutamic endopeptidase [Citricoccus sp. SGAir0253]QCU78580.1 CPBP family intramembrane metalloprotease [Citricoccus sp. SGAir0253]